MPEAVKRTNNHVYGERAFWLKATEVAIAKNRKLTVIIRQGDRSDRQLAPQQWLPLNEPVPLYYISTPGDQQRGVAATFEPDDGSAVVIVGRNVTQLQYVKTADLHFASGRAVPIYGGIYGRKGLKQYLEGELAPDKKFSVDSLITVYSVLYLPKQEPATD